MGNYTSTKFENLVISDKCKTKNSTGSRLSWFENLVISYKCKTAKKLDLNYE